MNSKTDNTLLLPGSQGWDVWRGSNEAGYECKLSSDVKFASELDKISASTARITMGFPLRELLAVPFKVQTKDESLFSDLAEMHLEKVAIRAEEDAGVLTDVFKVGEDEEGADLLSVVLSAPSPEQMPVSSPGSFDISARFFPLASHTITLWQELGRWCFAVTGGVEGKSLLYFQALSNSRLDTSTARDVRLAMAQLQIQRFTGDHKSVIVWRDGGSGDPSDNEVLEFGKQLGLEIVAEQKPLPLFPEQVSRLVPADVKAEQRMKAERVRRSGMIAVALIAYLGLIGYFSYQYFTQKKEVDLQAKELEQLEQQYLVASAFNEDWNQLSPMVDSQQWPISLLQRAHAELQRGEDIRFEVFEARREGIVIQGNGSDLTQVTRFGEKLVRSMKDYDWSTPSAQSDNKTDRWKFNYTGTLKGLEPES